MVHGSWFMVRALFGGGLGVVRALFRGVSGGFLTHFLRIGVPFTAYRRLLLAQRLHAGKLHRGYFKHFHDKCTDIL